MIEAKKIIRFILIGLVIYSILGLFMQFVFSYFNQSPYDEKQLTLFNFVIPFFVTLGFMVYGSILLFKKPTTIKSTLIILGFAGTFEIIAIKWQIEFFLWTIKGCISEVIPILVGIIATIYVFVALIRIISNTK